MIKFKEGWIAKDKCGDWFWYDEKPYTFNDDKLTSWFSDSNEYFVDSDMFEFPEYDWKVSLHQVLADGTIIKAEEN